MGHSGQGSARGTRTRTRNWVASVSLSICALCTLLSTPAIAAEPASSRSATAYIGLSLTISPRASIRTTALCTEQTRGSALLRVTDASGNDLPRCGAQPREISIEDGADANESGVRTLLVTPV